MKRFNAGQVVEPGIYFNPREFQFASIDEARELPGATEGLWYRVPVLALLVLGPILGLTFVIFLPFIGLAMVGWLLAQKAGQAVGEAATATVRVLRPSWAPAMAYLFRGKKAAKAAEKPQPAADEWLDETKRRLTDDEPTEDK